MFSPPRFQHPRIKNRRNQIPRAIWFNRPFVYRRAFRGYVRRVPRFQFDEKCWAKPTFDSICSRNSRERRSGPFKTPNLLQSFVFRRNRVSMIDASCWWRYIAIIRLQSSRRVFGIYFSRRETEEGQRGIKLGVDDRWIASRRTRLQRNRIVEFRSIRFEREKKKT